MRMKKQIAALGPLIGSGLIVVGEKLKRKYVVQEKGKPA